MMPKHEPRQNTNESQIQAFKMYLFQVISSALAVSLHRSSLRHTDPHKTNTANIKKRLNEPSL